MSSIITRKIEVFVCESDKDLRKSYYEKIYDLRNMVVKAANMGMSHLFAVDNTMPYLSDEDKEKITFLGCKGNPCSKQNLVYTVMSKAFSGKPHIGSVIACLSQQIWKVYNDDRKKGMWNKSLRSYKSNMPIPFQTKSFINLRFEDYTDSEGKSHNGCFFTLIGVPFQMKFGRDRSNNRSIVENVINGTYKMATSSIVCDGKKLFLLLCVDIPKKEFTPIKDKKMYAFLGVMNPIICTTDVRAKQEYDSGMKMFEIGTKEEFNYRRRQIQEAVKRCQEENRYNVGGKGRKRKCQAIERFHEKENNYVDTKLHTYSRMLIDLAVKHKCAEIVLMRQLHREDEAKDENQNGDPFVLRNWTYYGLKEKIEYKAKIYGIKLTIEK